MSKKVIVCPGSGAVAAAVPGGKNPKTTCFRCGKRVGVIASSNKVKKHMYLGKVL